MDDKVWQEFYCNDCCGYFTVKLNMNINDITVEMKCPNCGRKHPRTIKDGVLHDGASGAYKEEIIVPKSAYHKEPLHKKIKREARNGEVIESHNDLVRDAYMDELWHDFHGGKD